ncbi:MAG: low temperature requirement protein A [Planctomycetota bacterium]|nr:low temperature requirement protein A [Planctomycetota bacterium]
MSESKPNKSLLINPIMARSREEVHRSATPLELFYDLIYVIAIASLAAQLHHALSGWHHVLPAIGMYCFLFMGIWWPWNAYTWLASGYDTDDAQFRLASFAQMVGAIVMASGVKAAFVEQDFLVIMIGYVTMRIPYVLIWIKVAWDDKKSRPVALRYIVGVSLLQIAWTIAVLHFPNWNLFVGLMALELVVPYLAEISTDKGVNTKYHSDHIEERLGLLTIIVLGESMLASVMAFEQVPKYFSMELIQFIAGTLMILFSMWWLYFDDKVESQLGSESKAFIWAYGHYFIYAFATAVGALISVNIDVLTHHAEITESAAVLGLGLTVAGFLMSVWICHDCLLDKKGFAKFELPLLAILVIAIAALTKSVILIGVAFVALNAIRLVRQHRGCRGEAPPTP